MKTKAILFIRFIFVVFITFDISAQNLEGEWFGFLDQSVEASKLEGYQFFWKTGIWKRGSPTNYVTLRLDKGSENQYTGIYHITLPNNTTDYADFTMVAHQYDSILKYKTIDRITQNSKYTYCFSKSDLKYRSDQDFEYLEGKWIGWNYRNNTSHFCAGANIVLKRTRIRQQKIIKTIEVPRKKIKIMIWDNDREDGDIITLKMNDKIILSKYKLKHKKRKLNLQLNQGTNTLLLKAENLGSMPPNTATIIIKSRSYRKTIILNSDMTKSEALKIIVAK